MRSADATTTSKLVSRAEAGLPTIEPVRLSSLLRRRELERQRINKLDKTLALLCREELLVSAPHMSTVLL
jgi:hypothetical protein